MKVNYRDVLHKLVPLVGSMAIGIMAIGCGDKSSNPDAVTIEGLKFPSGLKINDAGNGTVKLMWSGANNEKDFDGYNIYGAKATAAIEANENTVVQMLNEDGSANESAKAYLTLFNYNGTDLETVGTKTDPDASFSFLPIYKNKEGEGEDATPLLPTCKPAADGTCIDTTTGTKGSIISLNGMTSYQYSGLKVGTKYCFLILSSIDEGSKVSQTSSEVRCITPNYSNTLSAKSTNAADQNDSVAIDLTAMLATCVSGTCTAESYIDSSNDNRFTTQAGSTSEKPLYFERFKNRTDLSLTAGKNTALKIIGYKNTGFADSTLPDQIPALTNWTTELQNGGGYSNTGYSLPLKANYMYIVAVGTTDDPTAFHYYWLWVKSTSVTGTDKVEFEVRLPKDDGKF